jgi:hypothetical protein
MIDKAIARITDEMMKANDPLITMLEEHLTGICTTDAVAEKLLQEEKTLKGASKIIWDEARTRKVGNGAHISDAECCEMAEAYFGITEEDKAGCRKAAKQDVIDITQFL